MRLGVAVLLAAVVVVFGTHQTFAIDQSSQEGCTTQANLHAAWLAACCSCSLAQHRACQLLASCVYLLVGVQACLLFAWCQAGTYLLLCWMLS